MPDVPVRDRFIYDLPFGARLGDDGRTRFRIWAPSVTSLVLVLDGAGDTPMHAADDGWFEVEAQATAGTRYRFRLPDGLAVPDPAARLQDGDVHGWSVVTDPRAHEWHQVNWNGRPWNEVVIYEVHAGLMGGFSGVMAQLERLRDIGFTAIELMPIADFPGTRNWGYDGVLPFAPDASYGTPGELKTLIDRAHALGLMVFLDVVYNHFGPDGAYLHAYANLFFDEGTHSAWGAAIDFKKPQVVEFFTCNAVYWLREYRFDGLRFDALSAIHPQDVLPELARAIRAAVEPGRHVHLMMEHEGNVASLLGPDRFDAQWTDDVHHCLHVLLTGELEGYYEDFTHPAEKLARCMAEGFAFQGEFSPHAKKPRGEPSAHLPPTAFVVFMQNHDQTGNRAMGERLTTLADPDALRAATALLLLMPNIPLVFMGDEGGARTPFLFFTDHHDELAELVRVGRRREFGHFAAFSDEKRRDQIPDPNAPDTYEISRFDPNESDPEMLALYRVLLGLRHRHIVPGMPGCRSAGAKAVGEQAVIGRWIMSDSAELVIACNLGPTPIAADAVDGSVLFESREGDAGRLAQGRLPARSTVALVLGR